MESPFCGYKVHFVAPKHPCPGTKISMVIYEQNPLIDV